MKFFGPDPTERVATALEGLLALYKRDLEDRGVVLDVPAPQGEGECYVTDDDAVATLIARIRSNSPTDSAARGFYVGGDDSAFRTPAPEEGQTTEIGVTPEGRFGPVLFGSNWGFNTGPEGAEESGSGFDGDGGSGIPTSRDVRQQRSRAEQEIQGGPNSRPLTRRDL